MSSPTFRAGVGVVVAGRSGEVLALRRIDLPDVWQMVQGGIEQGETVEGAAFRELEEETGIRRDKVRLVAEHPHWLVYQAPRPSRKMGLGQAQKWVLMEFLGTDEDVRLDRTDPAEFTEFRWTTMAELVAGVVEFKRHVYEEVEREFGARLKR